MIVWLIGLSGAGKTTIAKEVCKQWRREAPGTVHLDGDQIREFFGKYTTHDPYSIPGRRANAERIARISLWLDQQSINVVASVLCIFPDVLDDNRERFSAYREVFIDAPMSQLIARDSKGLYGPALEGNIQNVVGVDIPFPRPETPDIILDNSDECNNPQGHATYILRNIGAI